MAEQDLVLPRVMIGAPHGKSGKTVVVIGILRALEKRGVPVQPFKKGPDYIDPGWHGVAARRQSRNLDCFFMDADTIRNVIHDASDGAQIGLLEGAMGLFDGMDVDGSSSSAEVAKQTATPVILVIDVTRMTRSVAAIVMGFIQFDPSVRIEGVILNRYRGKRHENIMRQSIERYCGIPVLGAIPENPQMKIPDRHLGLVTSVESDYRDSFADEMARIVEEYVDIDVLMDIASSADPLPYGASAITARNSLIDGNPVKIAVVRDRAFSFYYPENLASLEQAGAELVYVDSLKDASLPDDISGLYIGGGFPEVFADELQANEGFRASVRKAIEAGIACCAECGGLMYLARSIWTDGSVYQMAGAFGMDIAMETKRQGHGYSIVMAREDHPWLPAGTVLKGHEHHHSKVLNASDDLHFAYENQRGRGIADSLDGVCRGRTVASYAHVNAISSPEWAEGFVAAACDYRASLR